MTIKENLQEHIYIVCKVFTGKIKEKIYIPK